MASDECRAARNGEGSEGEPPHPPSDVNAVDKELRGRPRVKATNKGLAVTFLLSGTRRRGAARIGVGGKGVRADCCEITGNGSAGLKKRTVPKLELVLTKRAQGRGRTPGESCFSIWRCKLETGAARNIAVRLIGNPPPQHECYFSLSLSLPADLFSSRKARSCVLASRRRIHCS